MRTLFGLRYILCFAMLLVVAPLRPAKAAEPVTVGVVGSASALIWLYYIAKDEGFFTKNGLDIDLIAVSSAADAIRQLSGGSLNVVIGTGIIDPIRASLKGSSIALVRVEGQVPPYALLGKPGLKGLADLKGKTISVGGLTDVTKIYVGRMLTSAGLSPNDADYVYAGATAPRFGALQAGAVDAAIVAPPYNFKGQSAGMVNLGDVSDFVKNLPFAGDVVERKWAAAHPAALKAFLSAYGGAIDWFYDTKNKDAAVALLVKYTNSSVEDANSSYDFFQKIKYFEPSGKVSRLQLQQIFAVLKELGEDGVPTVDQVTLSGVTQMAD